MCIYMYIYIYVHIYIYIKTLIFVPHTKQVDAIAVPALPQILQLLAGITRGFAPAQVPEP